MSGMISSSVWWMHHRPIRHLVQEPTRCNSGTMPIYGHLNLRFLAHHSTSTSIGYLRFLPDAIVYVNIVFVPMGQMIKGPI